MPVSQAVSLLRLELTKDSCRWGSRNSYRKTTHFSALRRINYPRRGQKQLVISAQVKVGIASAGGCGRQGQPARSWLCSIARRYGACLVAIPLQSPARSASSRVQWAKQSFPWIGNGHVRGDVLGSFPVKQVPEGRHTPATSRAPLRRPHALLRQQSDTPRVWPPLRRRVDHLGRKLGGPLTGAS